MVLFSLTRVSLKDPGFYSYLIITPQEFEAPAELLADYRREQGVVSRVLTVEDINNTFVGQDISEKIRNAIKFYYDNFGVRYVFLAADNDRIPARIVLVRLGYGDDDYIPSDYYYMCLDGSWNFDNDHTYGEFEDSTDLYPEVAVTRGTFHSENEFYNYVGRIKHFEKHASCFANRAVIHSSTIQAGEDGSYYTNIIASGLSDSISKIYLYQDDSTIVIEDINNYLRSGSGYFLTMSHGDINGFYANYANIYYSTSSIPDDSTDLTMVDIFSCHGGAIDRMCLLEGFFMKNITIAGRASSRNDFSFTVSMRKKFYEDISSGMTLGDATVSYRLPYMSYGYSGDNGYRYVIMSMITLGEPFLRFYSVSPHVLGERHFISGDTLYVKATSDGDVPLAGAQVVLYKEGDYIVIDTTNLNGIAIFPVSYLSSGYHSLDITKRNYLKNDTTVYIPKSIVAPKIESITLHNVCNNPSEHFAGDTVVITIKGEAPDFYPFLLGINANIDSFLFFSDTLRSFGGNFVVRDTILFPWFSGEKTVKIRCTIGDLKVHKDTIFEVYGPSVLITGIKNIKGGVRLGISNYSVAPSDTVHLKFKTENFSHVTDIILSGDTTVFMPISLTSTDLPLYIWAKSNVIDTQIVLKSFDFPLPPSGLSATSISSGVSLYWDKDTEAAYYNVYRGEDTFNFMRLNNAPLQFPYYVDKGLSFDRVYYYAVTLIDSEGRESDLSYCVKGISNPEFASGWPVVAGGLGYSSPLVADITPLYPGKEIIIGASLDDSMLYAYSSSGVLLPGWPVKIDNIIYATPVAADLDGDGFDEVIIAGYRSRKLWVFKGDGSVLDGWPVPIPTGNFNSPSVADLNGDSVPEIVFVNKVGGVYLFNNHGSMLDSLHLNAGGFCTASIGDVNNDDTLDIVIGAKMDSASLWVLHVVNDSLKLNTGFPRGNFSFNAPLVLGDVVKSSPGLEIFGCSSNVAILFNSNGDTLWARPVNNTAYFFKPSISDIDGDGVPELLVNQGTGVVIFRNDGSYFEGYPTILASGGPSQCTTVDMNGDGYREVLKGSLDGKLYALTKNATIYPGFPIDLGGYAYMTSTVDDIDYDGELELVTASWSNMVFVYRLEIPDSFRGDWPTYQHDKYRTGNYNFKVPYVSVEEHPKNSRKNMQGDIVVQHGIRFNDIFKETVSLSIFDVMGRKIYSVKKPIHRFLKLKEGVYFVIFKNKNGRKCKRRVIVLK